MGTLIRISVFDRKDASAALVAARKRFEQIDQRLSDYKADSEINLLRPRVETRVSSDLFRVLTFAQRLSVASGGAFDVTLKGTSIGYQKIALGKQTVCLLEEGVRLDFGGLGKGFANDEAAKVLEQHGIRRYLIAASGDILVGDAPPDQPGWKIGYQNREVFLKRRAVSTSGNTYQPGHIKDGRTGEKLMTAETVTVLAKDSLTADALDTACLILQNPEDRKHLLRLYPGSELVSSLH